MNTVQEIQQAIFNLSPKDLSALRRWFEEFDARLWDEQLEQDAQSGKLEKIAERALEEYRAGNAKPL
ncbi:MAG: hypothetical protein OHK0031_00560 [Anaerolineales bacterium]